MDSQRPAILVVDDEPRSVELLQRTLRSIGEVDTALSGEEAWKKVRQTVYDLVVSDQRMPGLKGAELLARVADHDPHTGRVLLTGYADMQATISAINAGRVHAYVAKPWLPDQLALTSQSLIDHSRLARDNDRLVSELSARNEELEVAVSELRRAQHEILNRERLSAVGRMVAMIVHDFRSPLAVVAAVLAELDREGSELAGERREAVGQAQNEAQRMRAMCEELLELSRVGDSKAEFRSENLDDIIHSAVAAVTEEAGRCGVTIETELDCDLRMSLDASAIRRVVLNLARNAIEAMTAGGSLHISSSNDATSAVLRFVDTGPGIPTEIEDTLFDAFVTHGKHGGSGLGLAIVKEATTEHGGDIHVEKAEGSGAAFEIRLPLDRNA